MHKCVALAAGVTAFLCTAGAATQPAAKPDWSRVIDWREPIDAKHRTLLGEGIKLRTRAVLELAVPASRQCLEMEALQAAALMQALPFLAQGGAADDPKLFAAAKSGALSRAKKVMDRLLPEYAVKQKAIMSIPKLAEAIPATSSYRVPMVLIMLENFFAGSTAQVYEKQPDTGDRPFRPAFVPPLDAQRGIARLAWLLLINGAPGKQLPEGCLWEYSGFAPSPEKTCFSKSGTVVIGLRAALNLGVADYPEAAFAFDIDGQGTKCSRKQFRDRLADVLTHCVLTTVRLPENPADDKAAIGIVGFDLYRKFDTRRLEKAAPGPSLDVTQYRTVYATSDKGERLVSVDFGKHLPPLPEAMREAAYRYQPHGQWAYGAYHTASAAYVLVTAANALPMLLPKPGETVGAYYVITPDGDERWKVSIPGKAVETLRTGGGPWTGLQIGDLPINQRITQCLNFVVRVLTKVEASGERALNDDGPKGGVKVFDQFLSLEAAAYGVYFRGICCYGILKLGLALGEPDMLGPWPYYRDFCKVMADATYTGRHNDYWANDEFAILLLTRSYRPLFGRDTPK
jgi:hypothetical protein